MRFRAVPLVLLACLLALAATAAETPPWEKLAGEDTVSVVTSNEDGSQRYTTVWLVVVGGRGYLRTGDTTWGANVDRDPNVKLEVGRVEYTLRAEPVETEDERALVTAAFAEKYGWTDKMLGWLRGARPKILRLRSF